MAAKLKKGDEDKVIAGRDKGKTGEILEIFPDRNRALVAGVNQVKRHEKPSQTSAGGVTKKELPIHLSNLAYHADDQASRIGFRTEKNGLVRFMKKTGEVIGE